MNSNKRNEKNAFNNKCHKSVNVLMGQSIQKKLNKQQLQFKFTSAFNRHLLKLKIDTYWKWCTCLQLQTSNFQFLQLGYVSKNEKNRCSRCCCCYSVPPLRIRQISRSHFLKHNLDISLAYPSGMLFLTIFGEVMCQFIKITWKCVFILIKFAHGADIWNSLGHLCEGCESCPIRLSNDWNNFRRPLTICDGS